MPTPFTGFGSSALGGGVGSIPVGFAPVGGVGSPDFEMPLVDNMSPYDGAELAPPAPVITFDVIDIYGALNPATVKIYIDGDLVYSGVSGFLDTRFPGSVTAVTLGKHFVFTTTGFFFEDGEIVTVSVEAYDTNGNKRSFYWYWVTASLVTVAGVVILNSNTLRVFFSDKISATHHAYEPSRYIIESRTGGESLYVKQVTLPTGYRINMPYVDLVLRDHMLRRGSYKIYLDGLKDQYGRDTGAGSFSFSDDARSWPIGAVVDWPLVRTLLTGVASAPVLPVTGGYMFLDVTQTLESSLLRNDLLVDSSGRIFSILDNTEDTITVSSVYDIPALGEYVVIETPIGAPQMYWQLKSYLFRWMLLTADSVAGALAYVVSKFDFKFGGNEGTTGGVQAVRDGIVLRTSEGDDLNMLGQNYGVFRPKDPNLTDAIFREYVQAMAWKSKTVRSRVEEVLTIVLGPKSLYGWEVYEPRPNTVVVDIGSYSAVSDPSFASYFGGDGETGYPAPAAPSPYFATGDYLAVDASVATPGSVDQIDGISVSNPILHNGLFVTSTAVVPELDDILRLVKAAGINVEIYVNQGG